MCGSGKKRLQTKAEERGQQSTALDNQRAQDMQDRLAERRGSIDIPEQRKTAQTAATGQLETGGFDPGVTEKVRTGIEESKAPATRLAADTGFSGAGREGYQEFATTGGFSPEQADRFRRAGTRAVPAIYGRAKEEGERRLALQGGYSPGFESGMNDLTVLIFIGFASIGSNFPISSLSRTILARAVFSCNEYGARNKCLGETKTRSGITFSLTS